MSQIPEAVANKLYEKVLDYFEDVKGERMFRSSPTFRPALERKMAELANVLCEADGDPHVKVLVTHTEATDGVAEKVAKAYRKGKIKDVWGGDDHEEEGDKHLLRYWVPQSRLDDFLTDLKAEGLEARAEGAKA